MALLNLLPAACDSELRRTTDLTHFDYRVLANLSEAPERTLQMSALAERTTASLSRLSHVVTRLERQGWITREVSAHDARATNAVLTQSGWEKVVATAPFHVQSVRNLVLDALTPSQFHQLGVIAGKIVRRIEERTATP